MNPRWIKAGAYGAALAVALGAFGAHALEDALPADRLDVYRTANDYHFVHALALILCGLLGDRLRSSWPAKAFGVGLTIFSGTLYVLATRGVLGLESWSWLGAITPLGGAAFIAGWLLLATQLTPSDR